MQFLPCKRRCLPVAGAVGIGEIRGAYMGVYRGDGYASGRLGSLLRRLATRTVACLYTGASRPICSACQGCTQGVHCTGTESAEEGGGSGAWLLHAGAGHVCDAASGDMLSKAQGSEEAVTHQQEVGWECPALAPRREGAERAAKYWACAWPHVSVGKTVL